MPHIFCIANQKGGVGKTTTTVNLAAGLAQIGQRVLIIDLDPQGNATMGSGVDKRTLTHSVYDVLLEDATVAEARVRSLQVDAQDLRMAPTDDDLAALQADGYVGDLLAELRAESAAGAEGAQAALALLATTLWRTQEGAA